MSQQTSDLPDGPEIAKRSRPKDKTRKRYSVEWFSRYHDEWITWGRYDTEEKRDQALKALRKSKGWAKDRYRAGPTR